MVNILLNVDLIGWVGFLSFNGIDKMKQKLQDKIFKDFPKLFAQKDLDKTKTCMCWGIETPDRWYDVIYKLCETIQNHINWNNLKQIEFTQVKEKFGSLRVYYNDKNQWIDGAIALADTLVREKGIG
jgi:predicted unusual protein kinase regulating ubiquinone biosynthesis (AarF/ABC1/UbiB family)